MADVLIVDDDTDNAVALAALMESVGHAVRIGYNGEEGMQLVEHRIPDLALVDVEMPILDGPTLVVSMVRHNVGFENIPIVLVSGAVELERVAQAVGTPYFLRKPYRFTQLLAVVDRALVERVTPHPVGLAVHV
jgi:CheY-like chemotaxis protein